MSAETRSCFLFYLLLFSILLNSVTPSLAQIDPDNKSTRAKDLRAEYMDREKSILDAIQSVLKRRDDLERRITELYAERNKCDAATTKLKDELRRVQIQLLE
ncbi:MAG: hypothetical protein K2X77_11470 [Candidatus Obscuribacterales bacterium]|jgi:hypothetical protein|nr:hypothetical protein [Candidatus Obscuribacterales bacterium]